MRLEGPVAAVHETVIGECHSRVSDPVRYRLVGRAAGREARLARSGVWRVCAMDVNQWDTQALTLHR